jgi:uncharacterized protein
MAAGKRSSQLAELTRATMTALAFCLGGALGAALSAAAIGGINPPAEEIVLIEPIQTFEVAPTPRLLRLGTGAVTGAYFPVGGALCQIFNARRNAEDPLCVALASGGSKENLEALRGGDIELALVQSDWHFHAQRGSAAFFTAGGLPDLRSLLSVYKEPLTLLARRDSGVARLADLRGKRVSMGPLGSGARALMEAVMRAQGWRNIDFKSVLELDPVAQVDALCAGTIDVAAFASGHPNGLIGSAAQGCDAVVIPVTGLNIDRLLADNPFYTRAIIPGGLYAGNAAPVESFGVAVTLVARSRLAPELVERLVGAVAGELETFQSLHPVLAGLTPEAMVHDGLSAPPHQGAERIWTALDWK